jgi:hypothetical protein
MFSTTSCPLADRTGPLLLEVAVVPETTFAP